MPSPPSRLDHTESDINTPCYLCARFKPLTHKQSESKSFATFSLSLRSSLPGSPAEHYQNHVFSRPKFEAWERPKIEGCFIRIRLSMSVVDLPDIRPAFNSKPSFRRLVFPQPFPVAVGEEYRAPIAGVKHVTISSISLFSLPLHFPVLHTIHPHLLQSSTSLRSFKIQTKPR